jgi:cytochrome c peroxidase
MNRTPPGTVTGSPRWIAIVTLATAGSLAASFALAHRPPQVSSAGGRDQTFSNPAGVHRTIAAGTFDRNNPFFQELGINGRSCFTCHRPAQAWSVTPAELRERFDATDGLDPIFRVNDGSNCPGADVSTTDTRRDAFSLLLTRGVIRIALEVPQGAEFDVIDVDDPYGCGSPLASVSMYRRPLPTTNLGFLSAVMWDGRQTAPGQSIENDLLIQARDAVIEHAEGVPPSASQLRAIVAFELGNFTAQERGHRSGALAGAGVRGGPAVLAREPFCIGINDPLGMLPAMPGACLARSTRFDPSVFTLFRAWTDAASPERQAIARGEAIFNTRQFAITGVAGLNGAPTDPVTGPLSTGTCTICHDTPAAGNHSVAMALNIGIAAASRRTSELPLYTLRHRRTGEIAQTTDPGRAMVTGKWSDVGKFKGPILRALAARPPYFHDGSASTLAQVIEFYDTRFGIKFSEQEKADLLAFLEAL